MADLFAYLKWRGDLSFTNSPLNQIDALILSQLSYINFSGIISELPRKQKSLKQVATEFSNYQEKDSRSNLGLVINPKTIDLLQEAANTPRFSNIQLCNYKDSFNPNIEEQFCAITALLDDDSAVVIFRGTDDTIVGWKEDFNLALKQTVPAQKESLKYLENAIENFRFRTFFIAGHSKGGNLAIFSGAHLKPKYQNKIKAVYNFDGPGFVEEEITKPHFVEILKKTTTVFPQGSIIGMIFKHQNNFLVVQSDGFFIMQHDPFTWKLEGTSFLLCDKLEKSSAFFHKIFNEWFISLDYSQKEELIKTIFDAVESTNAKTNSELTSNWVKNSGKIIKSLSDMDPEIKKSTGHSINEFFKLAGKNIF